MLVYPYAVPPAATLAWPSDLAAHLLMVAGLVAAFTLATVALRARRSRVVPAARTEDVIRDHSIPALPRVAA